MSRPSTPPRSGYDPFGERIDAPRAVAFPQEAWRTGLARIALFWAVALVLLAGRAYLPVHASAPSVAVQQASLR